MQSARTFAAGVIVGAAMTTVLAQSERIPGRNYVNHVAISVANFDEMFAFYTQKLGFREAFTVRNDQGQAQLAYVQVSRDTFVELQRANATRPAGLNHFGLHVENLRAVVDALKQRGVTVEEPRVRPDDASVANATDPQGTRIELFEFGPNSPQGKAIASWK